MEACITNFTPSAKLFDATRLAPDNQQLAIWSAPRYWVKLRGPFDKITRRQADDYLRSRGSWPINWFNFTACLKPGRVVPFSREDLFRVLSKGADEFRTNVFVALDRTWEPGVAEPDIAPTLKPKSERMTPKKGVVYHVIGRKYVRTSDGEGITKRKPGTGPWVQLTDKRRNASREYQEEFVDFEDTDEILIRRRKNTMRRAREMIGEVIEALRHESAIGLDVEIDGDRKNVDIDPHGISAAAPSNGATTRKKANGGGAPPIPTDDLVEMNHLQKHCGWELADLAYKFLDPDREYVAPTRAISQRLFRARTKGQLPSSEETCPHCKAGEYPDPPALVNP